MVLSTDRVAPILLVLAAAIVYLSAFDTGFTFDDIPNITANPAVQPEHVSELPSAITGRDHFSGRMIENRPVAMLSFALNHLVHGLNTPGYHVVNIAVHAVNAVLIFLLIRLLPALGGHRCSTDLHARFAFWSALVWALHPVNTQAVTYIVQRMTSLAALGFLAAMLVFVLWRTQRISGRIAWPAIMVAFIFAVGSKSHTVTLPAALLLIDVVFYRRFDRPQKIALVAMFAGGIALAAWYLTGRSFWEAPAHRDFSSYERMLTQGRVLWHYLGLWFWPDPGRLQLDYNIVVSRGWFSPWNTGIAWTGLLAAAAVALTYMRRYPWPAFAVLFFLVASSVEASFITLELVFEHRVYLPGAFLAAGVASIVIHRLDHRFATPILLVIAVSLALGTIERNRQWADVGNFWQEELERGAKPHRAAINAAYNHIRLGQPDAALGVIRRVSGLTNLDPLHWYQLKTHEADALQATGQHEEAIEVYREMKEVLPRGPRVSYSLGNALIEVGKREEAKALASEMLAKRSEAPFALALKAATHVDVGDYERAAAILKNRLQAEPQLTPTAEILLRLHLADAYRGLNRYEGALDQYRQVIRMAPENWMAWSHVLYMLEASGDTERATNVRNYLKERGVNPDAWRS